MKRPNVVLITFDSGRADHFGFMGYKKNTSPFLDSLARESAYCTRAFGTGPGSPQAFVGILTSTHPLDYGGYTRVKPPRMIVSEAFQQAGYETMGFHSSAYLSGYFGYDRGWSVFKYTSPYRGGTEVSKGMQPGTWQAAVLKITTWAHAKYDTNKNPLAILIIVLEKLLFLPRKMYHDMFPATQAYLTAEEMNAQVRNALPRRTEKPLFLWVHYMEPHSPYGLHLRKHPNVLKRMRYYLSDYLGFVLGHFGPILRLFRRVFVNIYDDSIRYLDGEIEALFSHLRGIGALEDDTVIAVMSDHGEEFFEHGDLGHKPKLYHGNLNVPLIFHAPSKVSPGPYHDPVSSIDVVPTLLHCAGVKQPDAFKGGNMFEKNDRPVISQIVDEEADLSKPVFLGAAIAGRTHRLIHWAGKKMLFALDDRFDRRDLYAEEPDLVRELAPRLAPYEHIAPPDVRA